jgi:hypothetical protein
VGYSALVSIVEIQQGALLRVAGKVVEARELLSSLLPTVNEGDDALARVFLAHSLADVQDDPQEELRWDLAALEAMEGVTEARATAQQIPGGRRALYPSLHLNLAESYLKIGDEERARQHYRAGLEALPILEDDSYGQTIRGGFAAYATAHPSHAEA